MKYREITREMEIDLARRHQRGDQVASTILLRAHEPYLLKVARHYARAFGIDIDDLLQEARLGFLKGVRRFDPERGIKLITYASYWARHYAERYGQNSAGVFRVPVYQQSRRLRTIERGISTDLRVTSQGGEQSLADTLTHPGVDPETEAAEREEREAAVAKVRAVLPTLTKREMMLVRERIARDKDDQTTLLEIGRRWGVSRERVRQIEVETRRVLRQRLRNARAA